jgi:hypothetical protein
LIGLSFLPLACRNSPRERLAAVAVSGPALSDTSSAPPGASTHVTPLGDTAPSSPTLATVRPGAYANTDPSDDQVVGPPDAIPDCEARLTAAGIAFGRASLPVHTDRRSGMTCGAPQVVQYRQGPGHIAYVPPPVLTCGMALALASFERIVQEEAGRVFHSPVVRIEQIGTYNCRDIVRFRGVVSEHAYANALDIARFTFKSGRSVSVLSDFDSGESSPARPAGDFLRAVSQRAEDEDVFSNVLTPFWDAAHKNHFHLDLARYRVEGVRPWGSRPPR